MRTDSDRAVHTQGLGEREAPGAPAGARATTMRARGMERGSWVFNTPDKKVPKRLPPAAPGQQSYAKQELLTVQQYVDHVLSLSRSYFVKKLQC